MCFQGLVGLLIKPLVGLICWAACRLGVQVVLGAWEVVFF